MVTNGVCMGTGGWKDTNENENEHAREHERERETRKREKTQAPNHKKTGTPTAINPPKRAETARR